MHNALQSNKGYVNESDFRWVLNEIGGIDDQKLIDKIYAEVTRHFAISCTSDLSLTIRLHRAVSLLCTTTTAKRIPLRDSA